MEIYLSPEFMKDGVQILNVISSKQKPLGYLTLIVDHNKMYVQGHCQEEGVAEDFKDLVKPYIDGMTKTKENLDVFASLNIGGKEIILDEEESES